MLRVAGIYEVKLEKYLIVKNGLILINHVLFVLILNLGLLLSTILYYYLSTFKSSIL